MCGEGVVLFWVVVVFLDRVSLYSCVCPGTHYVKQADLELTEITSAGKKGMHHHARTVWAFEISIPAHSDTSPTTLPA